MPFQSPCRLRIDGHLDVGVLHVDPHDLWVRGCDCLDRNPVVLLLVDELDPIRHACRRVTVIRGVIQRNGAKTNEVAGWSKGLRDLTGWPSEHLVDGVVNHQALGVPRIEHLIHCHQGIGRSFGRRDFALGQRTDQSERSIDDFTR